VQPKMPIKLLHGQLKRLWCFCACAPVPCSNGLAKLLLTYGFECSVKTNVGVLTGLLLAEVEPNQKFPSGSRKRPAHLGFFNLRVYLLNRREAPV
jgi:hypothetical protein